MEKRLTKKLIKKYDIVIESGIVECPLLKSFTIYTVQSEELKINWSGTGSTWLKKAKSDILDVINCE